VYDVVAEKNPVWAERLRARIFGAISTARVCSAPLRELNPGGPSPVALLSSTRSDGLRPARYRAYQKNSAVIRFS
jgi:hypothetical protein